MLFLALSDTFFKSKLNMTAKRPHTEVFLQYNDSEYITNLYMKLIKHLKRDNNCISGFVKILQA